MHLSLFFASSTFFIELIKIRREVRKLKKREQCPEERVQANTEFNRLTAMIKLNIKNYTED